VYDPGLHKLAITEDQQQELVRHRQLAAGKLRRTLAACNGRW